MIPDLALHAVAGQQYAPWLRRHLRKALPSVSSHLRDVSFVLVGDVRMSRLHQQFMGISGPTDVLTFPLDTDSRGRATSGEVIICVAEARRQARARSIPIQHELLLYAVHGLLHLCGFDDTSPRAYRKMHREEDRILARLGIGPVFAREA